MLLLIRTAAVLVGLLMWGGVYLFWKRAAVASPLLRVIYLLSALGVYFIGYFLVFVGLGIDRWDDSSAWYWDTWLLFISSAGITGLFAMSRFSGALRILLFFLPLALLSGIVWFYLSVP